jgi:glutamine amidotransferase
MYFVHSYYVVPADISVIGATTDYGVRFCSFLWKDNIYAMQFHPERSHNSGLKIIENFVGLK